MRRQFNFATLVGVLMLFSCEKEIDVDLNSSDQQLIIEGNITDDLGPYEVRLTKSLNISDTQDFPFIDNALVIVRDLEGEVDTLVHVGEGKYLTSSLQGLQGHTYSLEVNYDGKTYTAISKMPEKVYIDSLRFERVEGIGFTSGVRYLIVPVYSDPINFGNAYRYIQTINGERDNSYIVMNDNIANGEVNNRPAQSFDVEIKNGDIVEFEMRCISTDIYDYFFTLSQIAGNGPGGGTTPSNPPSNLIGENCLGYFSAHTVQKIVQTIEE